MWRYMFSLACMLNHMHSSAQRIQKRALELLELELQVVMGRLTVSLMWILGTKSAFSAKTVNAPNS